MNTPTLLFVFFIAFSMVLPAEGAPPAGRASEILANTPKERVAQIEAKLKAFRAQAEKDAVIVAKDAELEALRVKLKEAQQVAFAKIDPEVLALRLELKVIKPQDRADSQK